MGFDRVDRAASGIVEDPPRPENLHEGWGLYTNISSPPMAPSRGINSLVDGVVK